MANADPSQFKAAFLDEAGDHMENLERGLLELENGDSSSETMNAVFRAAHSIKGSAAIVGFHEVARYTHGLENLLDQLRSGDKAMTKEIGSLLVRATDGLGALLDALRANDELPDLEALVEELAHACGTKVVPKEAALRPPPTRFDVRFKPAADLGARGIDSCELIRELHGSTTVYACSVDPSALLHFDALDPTVDALAWRADVKAQHEEVVQFVFVFAEEGSEVAITASAQAEEVAEVAEAHVVHETAQLPAKPLTLVRSEPEHAHPAAVHAQGAPKKGGGAAEASSLRVSTEKVDRIIDLVSEMVISQAIITDAIRNLPGARHPRLTEALAQLDRDTRELQERVMAIRMLPIGTIFGRVSRIVRDVSTQIGKEVDLHVEGEETELDKSVIERVTDPILHLVRNAIDHGLERPDARVASGKSPRGTVRLIARHRGGNIQIEVADDGAGLDLERIRAKGIERGIIQDGVEYSREQLQDLILAPGFSTAAAVTDISGRGVGMDVVKRNIEALNGTLAIDSEKGRGTTFRITLPLTLAIMDGLLLGLGADVYIVPLLSVVESIQITKDMIRRALGRTEFLTVRGDSMPLVRLSDQFGVEPSHDTREIVVVVETDAGRIGLVADAIHGQGQVVVKNLDAHFRRVDGLAGATILGDGRVGLILDVGALVKQRALAA